MIQQEQQQQDQQQQQEVTKEKKRLIFEVHEGHNSKQTADKYRTDFRLFLKEIKIYDLEVLLDLGKEALQELVIKYIKSLRDNPRIIKDKKTGQKREEKYSRSTVQNRVAAIIYFLENNDIELNKRKVRRYLPPDESTNDDRPYTVEEIQCILSVCDLRTRVMVLLMASSGMRIGALHSLRIGDLTKLASTSLSLSYKIQVYARTRDKYYTFTTPECAKAIDEYLGYRVRCGEILKDESPLFRRQFNRFSINKPLFISQPSVMEAVDDAIKKAGCKSSKIMRSHAFRKGFKSICEPIKVSPNDF
ncbi:MAG: tyrosine-type recombinase/integrase [Nitrososphaeraceae archaeon]